MRADWLIISCLVTGLSVLALMLPKRPWLQTSAIVALTAGLSSALVMSFMLGRRYLADSLERSGVEWTNELAAAFSPFFYDLLRPLCLVLLIWVLLLATFALRRTRL